MNWDKISYVNALPVFKSADNRGADAGWVMAAALGPKMLAVEL